MNDIFERKMQKKNRKKTGCGCVVAALLLFLLFRTALDDSLVLREYTVESSLVTAAHTYVVLTDLHSTYYGASQKELAAEIMRCEPEAVFLVGDIADDKEERQFTGTAELLGQIAEQYPCYYVTGNHERWLDYTDDIHALFASYGVTVLRGDSADLGDNIRLCGLDDPLFYADREAFLSALEAMPVSDDTFDILLSHRPEYAEIYAACGFDLTLSGHAHGGQVRIPLLLNGLYAPNQGWFPEYAGGRYEIGDSTLIVSRGLMLDDLPRVFNRPEIVVVHVVGN
ncbi:MAG: metallophosphoesterase [Clostridia bacterium]|nr:metallophosphoesterase [Clostridia bacterium]